MIYDSWVIIDPNMKWIHCKENVISVNNIPGSYPKVQCKYGDDSEQWIVEESFGVRMAPAPSNLIIINDSDEEDGELDVPKIPNQNIQTSPTGLTFPAPPLDLNLTPQEHKILELLDEDLGTDSQIRESWTVLLKSIDY